MDCNANDMFSYYRGYDLQDLIIYILNYDMVYRDSLGLPNNVTFGPEIEFEKISNDAFNFFLKGIDENFSSELDGSLNGGGEFNSIIMRDQIAYWRLLKKICMFLKANKADTCHNAGGHIHVGAHILGSDKEAWLNFIKLYCAYESVLFRFFYGDMLKARKKILKYAPPIADKLYRILPFCETADSYRDILLVLPMEKYQSVGFWHVSHVRADEIMKGHTIEFRVPNGTCEEVICQNNFNTGCKALLSCRLHNVDYEYLDYKLSYERISSSKDYCLYHEVNLKNALEFVDMVFDNNLDKIYFMKQYLKNFQSGYMRRDGVKIRKFFK